MKNDIKLPPEFISTNSIPVTVATIKRERMEEILREAIKADRAALQAECRMLESELATVKKVAYGNMDLLDECEKLRKDKERLDWLADPKNNLGKVQLPTVCVERNLHSLRDAIDDAMEQMK